MEIRAIKPTDHAQWLPLWEAYQAFYDTTIPQAVSEKTWARFLNPLEPMHCAVAEVDGRLAGMVHYIFHRSCWTDGDYCYLQDLFTAPAWRGKGVARALIGHVYGRASRDGAARVWWLTHESNQLAMRLYDQVAEKSGFVQYRKGMG